MRHIAKGSEPDFWKDFKRRHKGIRYNELHATPGGDAVRAQLRDYMVAAQLGLCAYCCCGITPDGESSLNEHIRPEASFPNETMDYSNLVASCAHDNSHCGPKKDNWYDPSFVSPLEPTCADHFAYRPNGRIEARDARGEMTIDALNLNSRKLVEAREAELKGWEWADEGMLRSYVLTPTNGVLHPFADMFEQLLADGQIG